jgi:hypothetical protein
MTIALREEFARRLRVRLEDGPWVLPAEGPAGLTAEAMARARSNLMLAAAAIGATVVETADGHLIVTGQVPEAP